MSFLVGAVLLTAAVVFFVLHPLITGKEAPLERDDDEMTDAEAHRRVTLLALRDVEYDRTTGKLDEEDYQALRRELSVEALAALEAEEAERRRTEGAGRGAANGDRAGGGDDVEREIARAREGLRAGTACDACGWVNRTGSRFCAGCGRVLGAGRGSGDPAP